MDRHENFSTSSQVNNHIYHELGERWYEAHDDPVALLRAESKLLVKYVLSHLPPPDSGVKILDVGCGGGFNSNALAEAGYDVTAVDVAHDALKVAQKYDSTGSIDYRYMDAYKLEFTPGSFDVILAMDFLEHVDPDIAIREISRTLKPGGHFFFNTFSKNPVAWLVCIKGVEWFIKNTPKDLHVLDLFISPRPLSRILKKYSVEPTEFRGMRPKLNSAFFNTLKKREVHPDFEFTTCASKLIGYCGFAVKQS